MISFEARVSAVDLSSPDPALWPLIDFVLESIDLVDATDFRNEAFLSISDFAGVTSDFLSSPEPGVGAGALKLVDCTGVAPPAGVAALARFSSGCDDSGRDSDGRPAGVDCRGAAPADGRAADASAGGSAGGCSATGSFS